MHAGVKKLPNLYFGSRLVDILLPGNGYCNKNVSMNIFQLTVKKKEAGRLMQFKTYIVFSKSSVILSFPVTTPFCT